MALTNAQYNEIMREYDQRQLHNQYLHKKRMKQAYELNPRLKEVEDLIATYSISKAKCKINGDTEGYIKSSLNYDMVKEEKSRIISSLPFTEGYLEPLYTCKDCKDTGYINNEKCHCFKQAIINTVYSQSNIKEVLECENFNTFRYDYFSDSNISNQTGLSSLQTMKNAVTTCQTFVDDFNNKPKNLFFIGETGVGKTFLSNCVAKALLDKGHSVIYFTAFQIFDILSKGIFEKDADAIEAHHNIFDCDLLIIDDLGTEVSSSFTSAQLFLIVNERILRKKSTIISTNLNLNQMVDVYSERTLSRISSNYSIVKLFGEDIRIKKRQMR